MGGWKGEPTAQCQLQEKLSITDLRRILREELPLTGPSRERRTQHLLQETDYPCNSDNEKETVVTLNSCFFSNGLLFKTTPPNFPFLLHKITFLSCCWVFFALYSEDHSRKPHTRARSHQSALVSPTLI